MSSDLTGARAPSAAGLRRGVIGVPGMVVMALACAAPLTAMASNLSLSLGAGAGRGTLGWIVAVGLLLAVFAVGYVALSRQVVSAGAVHAFVGYGLGPAAGGAVAVVATIAYNLGAAAMVVASGYFTDLALVTYTGLDLPWVAYSAVALVVVGLLGHYGVEVASRLTAVVTVLQFVLLAVLAVAVLVENPGGFDVRGFTPTSMATGGFALTIVFVLLSFGGYEAAAVYGEECRAPLRDVRRATYLVIGVLGVVFLVSTWALVAAVPDVEAVAARDPGGLLDLAAGRYLGPFAGALVATVVAVAFLAAAVSFHHLATRYEFALGRAGLLPGVLARTHPRRGTPTVAIAVQLGVNVVIIVPFALAGADPLAALFPAVSGVTSLAAIIMLTACSVSAVVASLRGRLPGSVLATRVAPALAAVGLVTVGGLIVINYDQVTGSADPVVAAMPAVLVVGLVGGVIAARRLGPEAARAVAMAVSRADADRSPTHEG